MPKKAVQKIEDIAPEETEPQADPVPENPIWCVNLGDSLFLGQITTDEQCNIQPLPNGWKIKLVENVDGTWRMVFIYINLEGTEIEMYNFNPPSSLNTSQFRPK